MRLHERRTCAKRGCSREFIPRSSRHKYCLLHKSRKPTGRDHDVRYGPAHRRLRSEWAARMRAGVRVECARCGDRILPGHRYVWHRTRAFARPPAGSEAPAATAEQPESLGSRPAGVAAQIVMGSESLDSRPGPA